MKLLLCLCLIFCFKTVFAEMTCYVCQGTNINKCLQHNTLNLQMCCSTNYAFYCERVFGYYNPIPDHLFLQYYPNVVSEFLSINSANFPEEHYKTLSQQHVPRVPSSSQQDTFPVPFPPNYNNYAPNPNGQRSSSSNGNHPSNSFIYYQNNPQHNYPPGRNFPQRPPNYVGVGPAVPFQPNPNFSGEPTGFYDNNNDNSNYGGVRENVQHTQVVHVVNGVPYVKQYSIVQNNTDIGSKSYSHTKEHNYESVNGVPVIDKTRVNVKNDAADVDAVEETQAELIPSNRRDYRSVRIARSPQSDKISLADIRKHNNFKLLPSDNECGRLDISDLIFPENAQLGQFPWLALLEYNIDGKNIGFKCGGTLINNRYVLTAAHCVSGKILKPQEKLFSVRLGEHDLSQEIDCEKEIDSENYCSDPPLNLEVEEIILHNAYNSTTMNIYNDIALIRLKENIAFTDYVSPICLPLNGERASLGRKMTIAGWGLINNDTRSNTKQKAEVTRRGENECKEIWKDSMNEEYQLCAGENSGRNTCVGDSGSPIMAIAPLDQMYIEGITSFGTNNCGGAPFLNVYTRVSSYLTWILDNIRA